MKRIMNKIREKEGFTLAELLIVVAIIAVLVAIAIPVFTTQLEKAREATDLANVRSAYAEVTSAYLGDNQAHSANVTMKSDLSNCQTTSGDVAGVAVSDILKGSNPCVVEIDASGSVKIAGKVATTGFMTAPVSPTP